MDPRLAAIALFAVPCLACGSDPQDIPAPVAAPQPVAAATEVLRCAAPDPSPGTVVTIDRSCASDADCAWGHEPVCCGPQRAIGVKKGDEKKIDGCASCPPKPCEIGPLVTEDDGRSADYPTGRDVLVSCVAGVCRTRLAGRRQAQ
jgi:hypothetical protein